MSALQDATGHALSGTTPAAIDLYEQAAHELRCLNADPLATIDRALQVAPEMAMAHVLRAWLHLLGTEPAGAARGARLRRGRRTPCRHRPRAPACAGRRRWWPTAAGATAAACWRTSPRAIRATRWRCRPGTRSTSSPATRACCATASRACAAALERRACRATTRCWACTPSASRRPATTRRPSAPAGARSSCEPRDGWAWHAVAHVHEMRNAPRGRHRLAASRTRITGRVSSFFAVHNWWHLALFQLELDRHRRGAGAVRRARSAAPAPSWCST